MLTIHSYMPMNLLPCVADRWDECKSKYYGPERDLVNFPHPQMVDIPPPVTLGFIPRSWVDALYEKTGVIGKSESAALEMCACAYLLYWCSPRRHVSFLSFTIGLLQKQSAKFIASLLRHLINVSIDYSHLIAGKPHQGSLGDVHMNYCLSNLFKLVSI